MYFTKDIIETSKKSNLYISQEKLKHYGGWIQYNESKICFKSDVVIKELDPFILYDERRYKDALFRPVLHNILFPETNYKLLGVSDVNGDLKYILEQPYIHELRKPTNDEIGKFLHEKGFLISGDFNISLKNDIKVCDIYPRNIIVGDNEELYVIDPLLYPQKKVECIIQEHCHDNEFVEREIETLSKIIDFHGDYNVFIKEKLSEILNNDNVYRLNVKHNRMVYIHGDGNNEELGSIDDVMKELTEQLNEKHASIEDDGLRTVISIHSIKI